MVRAAQGYKPAIFKAIRNGGCHTGAQLARQLTYLATKSSHVFDAHGAYDGRTVLTAAEIKAVARRFEEEWGTRRTPRLGHTSHLLMSFPIGTKPAHVREVVRGICDELFQGQGAHFDYLVAIHEDRAHPHAHIVLNRRSPDGGLFYLKHGHRFDFQVFREAMVAHGNHWGLRLEATRRLDRGVLAYGASTVEVQRARVEQRPPVERERIGPDLARALRHVATAASAYQGLAAQASLSGFEEVSDALLRASTTLARNGTIVATKEIYMTDDQEGFDGLLQEFSQGVRDLEDRISTAQPHERPRLQRGLNEVLASVSHLSPLGAASAMLREDASPGGLYERAGIDEAGRDRLDDPRIRAALETALQGTGISPAEVAARLKVGADNAALEVEWLKGDVRALATEDDLDLSKDADVERSLDRLDRVQIRLAEALTEAGVLRHARPTARDDAAALSEGELAATLARLRDASASAPAFSHPEEARAFREEVERRLDGEEVARLRRGDAEALVGLADTRLERLHLVKAYLESHEATQGSAVHSQVMEEISDEQIAVQRLRQGHGHRGPTHG